MSQANIDFIQNLYAAFARGDGAAVLASMDPAIVWNEAENFPYADRNPYVGHAAVAEGIFFRLATEWDRFQALPSEFLDAGDTVVVLGYLQWHLQGDRRCSQRPIRPHLAPARRQDHGLPAVHRHRAGRAGNCVIGDCPRFGVPGLVRFGLGLVLIRQPV
jgi:ketosteroid isomerase-like protein